jgi:hypothetical protein
MKTLINKQVRGEKNPDKSVTIIVSVSDGFKVNKIIEKSVKKEINVLAQYIINNMKEE